MIAARTAGSPHLVNGPTVETSTSPSSTSSNTELERMTSPWAVSSPPRRLRQRLQLLRRAAGQHRALARTGEALGHEPAGVSGGSEDDDAAGS